MNTLARKTPEHNDFGSAGGLDDWQLTPRSASSLCIVWGETSVVRLMPQLTSKERTTFSFSSIEGGPFDRR